MDSMVYEYVLIPLIISPMSKPFLYSTYILITHFLCVDVGYIILYMPQVAVILQTLQKLSTWDSEVKVWG